MTNIEFADELRRLAQAYEDNPGLPVPTDLSRLYVFSAKRDNIAPMLRAFGALKKRFDANDLKPDSLLYVDGQFNFLGVTLVFHRRDLCRVVTPAVIECDPLLDIAEQRETA